MHSLWSTVSSSEMNEELNELQNAGVNVLRVDVGWATLETSKRGYDSAYLAKLDALSAGAQARGIKIIATLWQTPRWASSGGSWNDAPSNPADFGAFAQFITSRYGAELAAVEVWNEPEIDENLIASNLPEAYVQMVKAVYAGAKLGDPAVPVLAGSLAYADVSFLRKLYADGMKGFYDGISVHPYADGANPANTAVTHSFLGGVESLHAVQQEAGDTTPEWVTEFGWPTGTSSGANNEQQQAEYLEQAFDLLNSVPYVEAATVYQLRDMETNASNPEDNFGLLRQNFTPRPAYTALKAAMGSTSGTPVSTPVASGSSSQPVLLSAPPQGSASVSSGSPSQPAALSSPSQSAGRTVESSAVILTLSLGEMGNTVIAHGTARGKSTVGLGATCPLGGGSKASSVHHIVVHVASNGRYRRAIGKLSRLRGCRVVVNSPGAKTARTARVR